MSILGIINLPACLHTPFILCWVLWAWPQLLLAELRAFGELIEKYLLTCGFTLTRSGEEMCSDRKLCLALTQQTTCQPYQWISQGGLSQTLKPVEKSFEELSCETCRWKNLSSSKSSSQTPAWINGFAEPISRCQSPREDYTTSRLDMLPCKVLFCVFLCNLGIKCWSHLLYE